ncbi:MAG: ATP-binding protein, partial [Bacteroidaceae bacterium]|nr:ATP-binding protein [Bacteroidaceae bacterium]
MIHRTLENIITPLLETRKAIVIMGARQVGKSTLLSQMLSDRSDVMWLNGDDPDVQALFSQMTSTRIRTILASSRILVIDEAQRIADIGLRLKLITDQVPGVQVIATGSSSFELASMVIEPLTGRKREFHMFPLTFSEMVAHSNLLEELRLLPHRMVYGYYPEVVCTPGSERTVLKELSDSYLYRDILSLEGISKPDKLVKLLQALAFQIGNQVSYNEIGQLVGLDPKTVERYVDILEKSFVIFRLGSFSRNLRNELKNSRKIYFWDLGIRNAVIGNFTQIESRTDVGSLWENFVIAERIKRLAYQGSFAQYWFWRTQQQKEIDYIEEEDGQLRAYEFKWNNHKANTKCPSSFANAYPMMTFQTITPENVDGFLLRAEG